MSNLANKLLERWLEIFLGTLFLAAVTLYLVLMISMLLNVTNYDYCTAQTFACRGHQMQLCMNSELYSRTECIQLVGKKDDR